MFVKEIYTKRRDRLKADVGSGIILLPGNEDTGMNYKDNIYHFRQDSSFLYFTGIDLPNIVFAIDIENNTEILFGDDLTVEQIVWTGPVASLSSYTAKAGIAAIKQYADIIGFLQKAIAQKRSIHFLNPYRGEVMLKMSEWLSQSPAAIACNVSIPLTKAIIAQRSHKSPEEIEEINKAVDATSAMQIRAAQLSTAGRAEYEIAGEIEGIAVSSGGDLSFPIILTTNGQYLHNHAGHNRLKSGQMVLCDCGAETAMHYAGDMTRTFPVDEQFTTQQREIYDIVLHAQQSAIDALKPGVFFRDIHFLASEKLAEGLKQIGLMKGDAKEAVQAGAHTLFFQCGLGHMMGLDVHDMENLGEEYVGYTDTLKKSKEFGLRSLRLAKQLEEGFVLTVEPGIYIIPELIDQWKAANKHSEFINYDKVNAYRSFGGIRIEEDFLITKNGSQLLGKPLAKSASDIEKLKNS